MAHRSRRQSGPGRGTPGALAEVPGSVEEGGPHESFSTTWTVAVLVGGVEAGAEVSSKRKDTQFKNMTPKST